MNEFTLTLNSPLTEEQWDIITDVDFEHTSEITFHTKHGKEVVFVKKSAQPEIIRCKDCKFWNKYGYINGKPEFLPKCGFNQIYTSKDDFCSRAERKNNG